MQKEQITSPRMENPFWLWEKNIFHQQNMFTEMAATQKRVPWLPCPFATFITLIWTIDSYDICIHMCFISFDRVDQFFFLFRTLFLVLGTDFDRNEVKYAKLCFVVLFHTYLLSIKLLTSIASLSLIESENDENWLFQLFMVNWTCTGVALVLHPVAPDRPAELIHSYHTKGL